MRQMQGGGGKAMGFGKSKAKLVSNKGPKITFADVAGIDEAKDELSEIVDFLRNPGKFQKLGTLKMRLSAPNSPHPNNFFSNYQRTLISYVT